MKILNICLSSPFTEGYSYQDNLLSEYQAKLGHEVTVLTVTRTRDAEGRIVETSPGEKVLENGVKLIRIKTPGKLFSFLGIFPGMKKVIEAVAPDFIFIHGLATFAPRAAVAYKRRHPQVPIVADNHQDDFNTALGRFHVRLQISLFRSMWKKWIGAVNRVYGTASWRVEFARQVYGIPEEKTDILVTGCTEKYTAELSSKTRREVRGELDLSDDAFVFIHGGKLNSGKRTLEVMRAFSDLKAPGAKLVLFGSVGRDIADSFEKLLKSNSDIIHLGMLPGSEVHRYLLASDFGLFPGGHSTLWEESIGSGLPCLFRNYGGKMHLDRCGNAVIVDDPGQSELAECMNKVLNDREFYRTLLSGARKLAPEFFYGSIAAKSLETAGERIK
ncbi:MAG: glycosyltransferase family 4 protein [Lentisphaeria bacterium]|nr:glycosyltransferase family 4 protein [Lentisphaeria bacterium]